MDDAFGERAASGIGVGDAEDIGVGDGFGGEAGAEDVADDSARAGGAAAVGFDGAGVIVGFDFEADGVGFVEGDGAGVVGEDGEAEGIVGVAVFDGLGAGEDGFLDEVGVVAGADLAILVIADFDIDGALEGFVDAVLTPGLG